MNRQRLAEENLKMIHVALAGVAQWVEALTRYSKVVSLIPGQSTYKNQPMNA